MTCPTCQSKTQVIDSREAADGIRRRRVCEQGHRVSTIEKALYSCHTGLHGFPNLSKARQAKQRREGAWIESSCDCGKWHLTPVIKTDRDLKQT